MAIIAIPPPKTTAVQLPFWRRLRWSLIQYFVLLAVVPLAVVVYITLSQINAQSTRQVFGALESVSGLKADQIRQWLHSGAEIMITIFDPDTTTSMVAAVTSQNEEIAREVSQNLEGLIKRNDNATDVVKIFEKYFLYTLDGRVVAASSSADLGKSVQRQPYFASSLTGSFTQPPYYSVGTGQLTIIHTEPLMSNGKVVGVLAGQLSVDTLSKIMTVRAGLGETGETYLVSNENNYFLTPSRFDQFNQPRAYHSTGIDNALDGKNGSGLYTAYRGVSVLGYYRWIPELQAGLIAEQDESEALAATRTVFSTSLLVAILSALLAILIGLNRITRISRPLRVLTDTATQIAGGNLNLRANVKERNEIGLLSDAFNQMTGQLAQNIQKLDNQIEEVERTNKQLQIATAQARESARLKSEFMSTMSHELRTPLNAMLGFTGILLAGMDGKIDETAHYMLERVELNAKRLLGLINDILDISKVEAGRMEVVAKPVELQQLVNQWDAQTGVLARQKGLEFAIEYNPALPKTVILDRERVTQVITNLLSNAFKFTEKGKVQLTVTMNGDKLIMKVSDSGIGIPPHALNYIFDEFRQVDGSWRRNYGGSGLGLAIVRNLCRIMDGKVSVESKLGEGSVFTVTLPLRTVEEAQPVTVG